MATISKLTDVAYVSGNVAVTLTKGHVVLICVHWTWNTNAAYLYNSGTAYINGNALSGYAQYIAENGDAKGDYMAIFPYLVPASGSVNVSLNPTDTITNERYIRLTVIDIAPTVGKQFLSGVYLAASATRARDSSTGSHPISLSNLKNDILVGLACSLNPNSTLQIAWDSPATEQVDAYVNDYNEVTVATQISESDSDVFSWTQNAGTYNGAVAVAVRESSLSSGVTAVFLSDYGVM